MSKRTEGPWSAINANPAGYRRTADGMDAKGSAPYVAAGGGRGAIAKPVFYNKTDDEVTANLKLIAAAPELLAACEAIFSKGIIDLEERNSAKAYDLVRKAIAKATN